MSAHWLIRYDPDDGEPYGEVCDCEIGDDHDDRGGRVSEPPVTKYELTVKIRGNTHDEIEDELLTLVRGGYLLDSDYGKRDAWNATGGRCTSVMVHTNPEQTPEAYAAELDAWWNERRAARREAQR